MLGMEMMLSNMIGMKPDEIKSAVEKTIKTIEQFALTMNRVEQRLIAIENALGVNTNEHTNGVAKLPSTNDSHIQH